jgi:hypothetical protein
VRYAQGGGVEGVSSHAKRSLANLANLATLSVDALEVLVRNRLKRLQYHPTVLDGFVPETGLTFDPQPPDIKTPDSVAACNRSGLPGPKT